MQNDEFIIGGIYSMCGGLFKVKHIYRTNVVFDIIKPINSITRDVKPWDEYFHTTKNYFMNLEKSICYKKEVITLMKYEPTLTVLYG